ncbi:MAG TPA: AAA family ATPase [Streptosporangiaceae bacterium]|nr:AAA family ATPase [Streptosporangiaceae bacterium]
MPRYVLTGAPGAGKTAILRALELAGHAVVEEAATDVILHGHALGQPHPEDCPGFLAAITALQVSRQRLAPGRGLVFFDRSPVCTLALARFLGRPLPAPLAAELRRVRRIYEPAVFFVRGQGFVTPTAVRRISLAGALAFEKVHEQAYRELGFELVEVPAGPLTERAAAILARVARPEGSAGACSGSW